jgi:TP901 family phage tail tape measure protein
MASSTIKIEGKIAGAALDELKKKVTDLRREVSQLEVGSAKYNAKVGDLKNANQALTAHRNEIRGIGASYGQAQTGIKGLMMQFAPMAGGLAIAGAAIGGITSAVSSWYQNNKALEKSLSSLQSLTGASTEDMKFYKAEAIAMGKTSTMSASQTVEAFKLIGSARPDLLKNKEALAEVTKETVVLAEAAEMDLGSAANSMAGAMNQFNLGASESGRIINALAAGSKEGAAEISDVTLSVEKFGAVASANNVTFEESVALTELMAEKNIKGAEAGTQLRNVLLNVATASALPDEAQKAMAKYGVNIEMVMNKAIPLKDRLQELAKVQKDQTALVKIFGKENVVAGQTILGNISKFDSLTKAVTGTNVAYEQQRINNDNLDGDLKKMNSAWEGFTLSIGGAGESMRGLVQVGTDVLNWTSDLITGLKEADSMKLETVFYKFADALTLGIGPLHDFYEEMIRINEISMDVIDSIKGEVEANVTLTESLARNNEMLASGNLTAEEAARINNENEQIISALTEKYPELTANLDLHKLSQKGAIALQKEMNKELLNQALASAQAAEAERLLASVVESTMKVQMLSAEIRKLEKEGGVLNMIMIGTKAKELAAAMKESQTSQKQLMNLGNTMAGVKKNLEGIDFTFGSKFKIQSDIIADSERKLANANELLAKTNDPNKRKAIESFIKGLEASIKNASKGQQSALDDLLAKNQQVLESDEKTTAKLGANGKKKNDTVKKNAENLAKELAKLIADTEKLASNLSNQTILDAFTDEKQKELFALQNSIEEKYKAEIEMAMKLMAQKGEIGIKATEQYNRLIALEDEEYEKGKAEIEEKYRKEKYAKDYENEKNANLQFLAQQNSLQDAIIDLKVTKAKAALSAVRDGDLAGYAQAKADLEKALQEQADLEKTRKLEALMDQRDDGIISVQEYNLRKEELELQHQQNIIDINAQSAEELKAIDNDRAENALNNISKILDISKQFSDAASQRELNDLNQSQNREQKALDEKLKNKLITEDQYNEEKKKLDAETAKKKYEIELDQFKKNQAFATAEAIIQGALAIAKVTAQTGVGAAFAVPLVIASTAAQLAMISEQAPPEAPQFAEGGYADVTGAKDGLRYRAQRVGKLKPGFTPNRPILGLFGEKGTEYVVPAHLLRKQPVANYVSMIEAERLGRVPQYAEGGFTGAPQMGGGDISGLLKQNNLLYSELIRILPNLGVYFSDKNIEDLDKNRSRFNATKN